MEALSINVLASRVCQDDPKVTGSVRPPRLIRKKLTFWEGYSKHPEMLEMTHWWPNLWVWWKIETSRLGAEFKIWMEWTDRIWKPTFQQFQIGPLHSWHLTQKCRKNGHQQKINRWGHFQDPNLPWLNLNDKEKQHPGFRQSLRKCVIHHSQVLYIHVISCYSLFCISKSAPPTCWKCLCCFIFPSSTRINKTPHKKIRFASAKPQSYRGHCTPNPQLLPCYQRSQNIPWPAGWVTGRTVWLECNKIFKNDGQTWAVQSSTAKKNTALEWIYCLNLFDI